MATATVGVKAYIGVYCIFCIARTDTQRNVYLKLAHVLSVGMQKYRWWPGDPAGGAHDAPSDPLAGLFGARPGFQ